MDAVPKPTILDAPPTTETLQQLARAGVLDGRALQRGLELTYPTPDRPAWERFLGIVLLVLGAGFLVSGVFFFFAYNWASLADLAKLGLVEALVVVAVGLTYWRGLDQLSGKIALGAAALLVGALLAVYGQIYQTGADAYTLFVSWAALIFGWVLIGRFTPLWVVWVALLNVSLGLYWGQAWSGDEDLIYLCFFLLNGAALLAWEVGRARGVSWLSSRWTPRLLALPVFVALAFPSAEWLTNRYNTSFYVQDPSDPWLGLMLPLFIVTSGVVLYVYSRRLLDLFMLTICAASLVFVFDIWLGQALQDLDELLFFLMGGLLIVQTALVVTWLRRTSKRWEVRSV